MHVQAFGRPTPSFPSRRPPSDIRLKPAPDKGIRMTRIDVRSKKRADTPVARLEDTDRDWRLTMDDMPRVIFITFDHRDARTFDAGIHAEDRSGDRHSAVSRRHVQMAEAPLGGLDNHRAAIQMNRDVAAGFRGEAVDREYVADFARQLGLMEIWERVMEKLHSSRGTESIRTPGPRQF